MRNFVLSNFLKVNITSKLITCLLITIIADTLYFYGVVTLAPAILTLLLCVSYVVHNNKNILSKDIKIILFLIIGQVLALIEDPNFLSITLVILGFIGLVFMRKESTKYDALAYIKFIFTYFILSKPGIITIAKSLRKYKKKKISPNNFFLYMAVVKCLFCVIFSIIFIKLFSYANPLIDHFLNNFSIMPVLKIFQIQRIVFWCIIIGFSLRIIRPRNLLNKIKPTIAHKENIEKQNKYKLLNVTTVTMALLLFNLIFMVQNVTDIIYFWGNAELPSGVNYASFAQEGAYTLVITALLAEFFLLFAIKENSSNENSPLIRGLVYLWVGQNIFLVISSLKRLMLYIEIYNLTSLRIAAIIWMILVMAGLFLINIRLFYRYSNKWLVNHNFVILITILYICSFINFKWIIAEYNISNSREVKNYGRDIDEYYLTNYVGSVALPVLIKYKNILQAKNISSPRIDHAIISVKNLNNNQCLIRLESWRCSDITIKSWRNWTFQKHRLNIEIEKLGAL